MHGVLLSIISARGTQFTFTLWEVFQIALDNKVKLSTVFHSQMEGLAEQTIHTIEDMLKACIIDYKGNWDDHLPLVCVQ